MDIQCCFEMMSFFGECTFGCTIKNQNIPENFYLEFIGQYEDGKSNMDVMMIRFVECKITRIPQGLTKNFPNLKILEIEGSKLKQIKQKDLMEYKNLKKFRCARNDVEYLPGDLFHEFKSLEWISFYGNNLKLIHPNILDGLDRLNYVNFGDNPEYSKCYSIYPEFSPNASLEEIKCDLFEKYPDKYELLKGLKEKYPQPILNIHSGFLNDLKRFISDDTTKDFQVQIDNHEFPVHKFLLSARSPTIAELLKKNPEVENLNLVDISMETFEIILKFLYNDELPSDDGTNFLHLFAAAGKLKIENLKNFAAKKLFNQVDENNIFEIFKLSNKYDDEELRRISFIKIKGMYPRCIFKDSYEAKFDLVIKIIDQFEKFEEAVCKLEDEF